MHPALRIKNKSIGYDFPCFIVAELSANHNQNFAKAVELIRAAAAAGVDAVKLQTYTPDTMTIDCNHEWFRVGGKDNPDSWKGKTLYELYQKAYTPWEWQPKLKKIAEDLGLTLFSSVFDETAVDFLEQINVPCYKVASYEINHIPLLERIGQTKKPVIVSIGYASLEDVELAIKTLRTNGAQEIALLHCITSYSENPKFEDAHLKTIRDLTERFGVVSGFSDNNGGIELSVIAVSLGASIVEKHFILDRNDGGPDAQFSIEPREMKKMIEEIRRLEIARGDERYGPLNVAEEYNKRFRRSIFVVKDVKKGETFTRDSVRVIRPADGLPPKFFKEILGKVASRDIERGTPLTSDHMQERL
jgi:pseudaminic acid synthase